MGGICCRVKLGEVLAAHLEDDKCGYAMRQIPHCGDLALQEIWRVPYHAASSNLARYLPLSASYLTLSTSILSTSLFGGTFTTCVTQRPFASFLRSLRGPPP